MMVTLIFFFGYRCSKSMLIRCFDERKDASARWQIAWRGAHAGSVGYVGEAGLEAWDVAGSCAGAGVYRSATALYDSG